MLVSRKTHMNVFWCHHQHYYKIIRIIRIKPFFFYLTTLWFDLSTKSAVMFTERTIFLMIPLLRWEDLCCHNYNNNMINYKYQAIFRTSYVFNGLLFEWGVKNVKNVAWNEKFILMTPETTWPFIHPWFLGRLRSVKPTRKKWHGWVSPN